MSYIPNPLPKADFKSVMGEPQDSTPLTIKQLSKTTSPR